MTLDELARRLAQHTSRDVRAAPRTLSEDDVTDLTLRPQVLLVDETYRAGWARTLATATQGGASVVVGPRELLEAVGADLVGALGPGRFVEAQEWRVDRAAAMHGPRGAARLPLPSTDRPRSLAENPLPPSPAVLEALRLGPAFDPRRYPPLRPERLEAALAARHGLPVSQVVVSAGGSHELLARALRALSDPGDGVLAWRPTYDQLPGLCAREGRACHLVAEGFLSVSGARLAYLASPNNPDSRLLGPERLAAVRRAFPPDRALLLDRAWAGFESEQELFAPPPVPPGGPVVVLHSMSKLFGLAGLRVGYALAPEPLAGLLRRFSPPYELPALIEEAALAALEDVAWRERVRGEVRVARARLGVALRARGWQVPQTTTHVLLASPPPALYDATVAAIEAQQLPIEECAQVEGALQLTVPRLAEVDGLLARLP